ncbi:hypothetical protein [Laspinema olomoucense]|uniref:hypothetical protein n=1 Tax=Laspinema olomoucense TaxID=3231600 RepID=UPI0021BB3CFF|nr:hypothetical protein [Laspinema sp. D3d]MCT7971251.1 hypothetical protein [Laspinema sp. D3d]
MNVDELRNNLLKYFLAKVGNQQVLQENEVFKSVLTSYQYYSPKFIEPYCNGDLIPNTVVSIINWEFRRAIILGVTDKVSFANHLQDNLKQKLGL